jgi:hypothetical protein
MKLRIFWVLLALGSWYLPARAEHATIDLRVFHYDPATKTIKGQESAHADEDPPAGGVNPRPLLKVKANESLVLQFFFTNTYPHGNLDNASIRYYVVREEKAGQKKVPDLKKGTVTQGTFKLNFKPNARVGARVAFRITKPGVYLLRVESLNTHSDHEHFAAIDLQVE